MTNAKQRFALLYGYDPTPAEHQPKSSKGKGKQQQKGKKQQQHQAGTDVLEAMEKLSVTTAVPPATPEELPLVSLDEPEVKAYREPEAAVSADDLVSPDPFAASSSKPTKTKAPPAPGPNEPQWFIRAAQGHSITSVDAEQLLEPVLTTSPEGLARVGEMVHGTRATLWDVIREQGLSKQKRQHIHLATAQVGAKSGMRATSDLYIFLDLRALLESDPPTPVFLSSNGVVLTPGNSQGIVPASMFKRVVQRKSRKEPFEEWEEVLWEDGKAVDPPRKLR